MATFMKCKACGFVTDQKKIKNVCPACGVPAKMFEPYTHPVSLKRRMILDLHTHPVLVHFPQAFALILLLFSFSMFFVPTVLHEMLSSTIQVLSFLLPFFVVGAIATGLLDGNIRFRKTSTPLLKKKIILGFIFFITSIIMAFLALSGPFLTPSTHVLYTLLTMISSLCGALLGLIGGKLLNAIFPG